MLSWLFCGGLVPILLLVVGIFFLVYLRALPLRAPRRMLAAMRHTGDSDGVSPFRALTMALAGTLGVGNIVGVANAVWIGGAGSIFWMWISALLAMILKYAEILLAVRHRRQGRGGMTHGGACYYIKDHFVQKGFFRTGVFLSAVFAALMVVNALSTGCIIQVNALSSAFSSVIGIAPVLSAVLLLALTLPFLRRGSGGVSALTEFLVPIMSGGYIVLSLAVLLIRHEAVGEAFSSIFRAALSPTSMAGGIVGFLTSRALRIGVMRGVLSNEAGCGTAPTAHAAAHTKSPAAQGVWGIFEVFVDTILLCTATALVILVSMDEVSMMGENPVMMTVRAYSAVLGDWSEWFFCAAIFCFGYATVLCWADYAMESIRFLSKRRVWRLSYVAMLCVAVLVGACAAPNAVWLLSDVVISAMTTLNLCILVLMRREIRQETLLWYQKGS